VSVLNTVRGQPSKYYTRPPDLQSFTAMIFIHEAYCPCFLLIYVGTNGGIVILLIKISAPELAWLLYILPGGQQWMWGSKFLWIHKSVSIVVAYGTDVCQSIDIESDITNIQMLPRNPEKRRPDDCCMVPLWQFNLYKPTSSTLPGLKMGSSHLPFAVV